MKGNRRELGESSEPDASLIPRGRRKRRLGASLLHFIF